MVKTASTITEHNTGSSNYCRKVGKRNKKHKDRKGIKQCVYLEMTG